MKLSILCVIMLLLFSCNDEVVNQPNEKNELSSEEKKLNSDQMIPLAVGNQWVYRIEYNSVVHYDTNTFDKIETRLWRNGLYNDNSQNDSLLKTYRMRIKSSNGKVTFKYFVPMPSGLMTGVNSNYADDSSSAQSVKIFEFLPNNPKRPRDSVYDIIYQPGFAYWYERGNIAPFGKSFPDVWSVVHSTFYTEYYSKGIGYLGRTHQNSFVGIQIISYKIQ